MRHSPIASTDAPHPATLMRYARITGVAMLLSVIFGSLGEMYIPGLIIVRGDAAATAANILGHPALFRLGFATYLVEGICDIALCLLFYVLLKPVNRNIALLSAFFGLMSMALYAVAESSYFAASLVLRETGGLGSFTPAQRNDLALLCLRLFSTIAGLFLGLYGIASMLRGYLMARSGYIPKILGVLFMIGGAGFFLSTATMLLAPAYNSQLLLLPTAVAGIPLTLWLLIRGVDQRRIGGGVSLGD